MGRLVFEKLNVKTFVLLERRLAEAEAARKKFTNTKNSRAYRTEQQEKLTPSRRARIETLSGDIPSLWNAETTTGIDRQSIFRALVERVVIETVGRTEYVNVMIRWSGGFESRCRILKPVGRFEWLESAAEIRELIERLKREGKSHAEVSAELNREGYHSTTCSSFTPAIVTSLCKKFRAEKSTTVSGNKSGKWGLRELAHELGLRKETLRPVRRQPFVYCCKLPQGILLP